MSRPKGHRELKNVKPREEVATRLLNLLLRWEARSAVIAYKGRRHTWGDRQARLEAHGHVLLTKGREKLFCAALVQGFVFVYFLT